MGREVRCEAVWGAKSGRVTALLESSDVIVRGAFRAAAPIASLRDVRAVGDTLHFRAGEDEVALVLGRDAPRWAAALAKPPPSLATKLGITETTRVRVEGAIDDVALAAALAAGKRACDGAADLVVARVDDAVELVRIAAVHDGDLARGVPLWVVYTKGKGAPLGETAVRGLLRERGLMDLKVASVSERLTALKFGRTAGR